MQRNTAHDPPVTPAPTKTFYQPRHTSRLKTTRMHTRSVCSRAGDGLVRVRAAVQHGSHVARLEKGGGRTQRVSATGGDLRQRSRAIQVAMGRADKQTEERAR